MTIHKELLIAYALIAIVQSSPLTFDATNYDTNGHAVTNGTSGGTERADMAATILAFQQYDALEDADVASRLNTRVTAELLRDESENGNNTDAPLAPWEKPSMSRRSAHLDKRIDHGSSTVAGADSLMNQKVKRDHRKLLINMCQYPIQTADNLWLRPVELDQSSHLSDLYNNAMHVASQNRRSHTDWYVKNGTYVVSNGNLSLAMRGYGAAATTDDGHLRWADLGWLAYTLNKMPPFADRGLSYVGNIATGDNSTIWADFAVSFTIEDKTKPRSELKHVFSLKTEVSALSANGGGKIRRRASTRNGIIEDLETTSLIVRAMDDNVDPNWPPITIPIGDTGFRVYINYGTQRVLSALLRHLIRNGIGGAYFDAMVTRTIGNGQAGPLYLSGHYRPPTMRALLPNGLRFAMDPAWAVTPAALNVFFRTLYDHTVLMESTHPGPNRNMLPTIWGHILEPSGNMAGIFSFGQELVGQIYQYVSNPAEDDEDTSNGAIGKFLRWHDEL